MGWKRRGSQGHNFSKSQRRRIAELVLLRGMSPELVAIKVGATRRGVDKIVAQARVQQQNEPLAQYAQAMHEVESRESKTAEEEPASQPTESTSEAPEPIDSTRLYLRWVIAGALSKIEGQTFIERLQHDQATRRT